MENESFSTLLAHIYQDLVDNFDLPNRLERLKTFAAHHPFLTLFGIFTVVLCSVPVACFVAFTLFSIFLTFGGFMFLEGTVLTFATIILGGVLIIMGILSIAFSLSVAVGLFIFHKGIGVYHHFYQQFMAVVGREVENMNQWAAQAQAQAQAQANHQQQHQQQPALPAPHPSSSPLSQQSPTSTVTPTKIVSPTLSPYSAPQPEKPLVTSSNVPETTAAPHKIQLPHAPIQANVVAPVFTPTVVSAEGQGGSTLLLRRLPAQAFPVSNNLSHSPATAEVENAEILRGLAGATPTVTPPPRIGDNRSYLRHRATSAATTSPVSSEDSILPEGQMQLKSQQPAVAFVPPLLPHGVVPSPKDSSSVEAHPNGGSTAGLISQDSSEVLNWDTSSSSSSSLNPGDQWEVLPRQTEKMQYPNGSSNVVDSNHQHPG